MVPTRRKRAQWLLFSGILVCAVLWLLPGDAYAVKVVRDKAQKVEPAEKEESKPSQKKLLNDVETQRQNAEQNDRRYDPWVDQNNDGVNDQLKNKQPPPIPRAKSAEPQPKETQPAQVETTKSRQTDSVKSTPKKKNRRR